MVATIAREFPRLRLDLKLIELLGTDSEAPDVEIAVDGTEPGDMAGYEVRPLLVEPYLAVVPATSALATRAQVDLAELRDEAWVDNDVARGPCRQILLDACSTVGFSPAFHIETQDYPRPSGSSPRESGSRWFPGSVSGGCPTRPWRCRSCTPPRGGASPSGSALPRPSTLPSFGCSNCWTSGSPSADPRPDRGSRAGRTPRLGSICDRAPALARRRPSHRRARPAARQPAADRRCSTSCSG